MTEQPKPDYVEGVGPTAEAEEGKTHTPAAAGNPMAEAIAKGNPPPVDVVVEGNEGLISESKEIGHGL